MKRPLSVVQLRNPKIIHVNNKIINQKQTIEIRKQKQNQQQQSKNDVQSNISERQRQKMPQSMKQFLMKRKNLRQKNNQKQQNQNKQINKNKSNDSTNIQLFVGQQDKNTKYLQEITYQKMLQFFDKTIQSANRKITCEICQGIIQQKQKLKAFQCHHFFCDQCINSYVKYKIGLFEEVYCPGQDCLATLDMETSFYQHFPLKTRRLYKKIHNFYLVQTNPLNKLCPKDDCDGVITLKQNETIQKCPKCYKIICSLCFLDAHEGLCQQFEVRYMQINLHYRQCTKCKVVVERIEGCNHITCKCGYNFCYICGMKWQHSHLCNPIEQILDEGDGCDWGESRIDHFLFLIKLPLKVTLITLYISFWVLLSFAAAPYNLVLYAYWLGIILIGGPIVFICDHQKPTWLQMLLFIIFPILMILCIPLGIQLFIERFQQEFPFLTDGFRCIIRI